MSLFTPSANTEAVADSDALARERARREERSAALSSLSRVEEELAAGDTEGAKAALAEAASALDGEGAAELRAATQSLDNEDLATARRLIEGALLQFR
jgi:hypothetical protein